MIVTRDGARLTICDGCYRPKRAGEDWTSSTRQPAAATSTGSTTVHYCPECCPPAVRGWAS